MDDRLPLPFHLAAEENGGLLSSLFKSGRRFTTKSFYERKGEKLTFRLPDAWLALIQKIVQQRLDPELEFYSDVILDALHGWLVNFLEENPSMQKISVGHEFKLREHQLFLDELDSYYSMATSLFENLQRMNHTYGIEQFVNDVTTAWYDFSHRNAPKTYLDKLDRLLEDARKQVPPIIVD